MYVARRKLKEVHKRLNELRELVQYYEQTSDMMVDAVNENVKEEEEEEDEDGEEEETEDGSMFEAMFDSEQENRQSVTNIRCAAPLRTCSRVASRGCQLFRFLAPSLRALFALCLQESAAERQLGRPEQPDQQARREGCCRRCHRHQQPQRATQHRAGDQQSVGSQPPQPQHLFSHRCGPHVAAGTPADL